MPIAMVATMLWSRPLRAEPLLDLDALGMEGYAGPHFRVSMIESKATLLDGGPLFMLRRGRVGLGASWSSSVRVIAVTHAFERWYACPKKRRSPCFTPQPGRERISDHPRATRRVPVWMRERALDAGTPPALG